MKPATLATGLLLCGALAAGFCEPVSATSASALVESMRAARESDGFEMRVTLQRSGDAVKIALIGQFRDGRERLLVRGIAPANIRGHSIVSERFGDRVESTSFEHDSTPGASQADPLAGIFGSALIVWDLMTPWWDWPVQIDEGPRTISGHACTQVRSRPDRREASAVAEAISCVDALNGLAWKTTLLDSHHHVLRSIEVTRVIRTQAGRSTARSGSITDADGAVTLVEVYGGDEHYEIRPDTFETPEHLVPARR
jgi:hypothetical protein